MCILGGILWEERKKFFLLMGKMEPTPYRISKERDFELHSAKGNSAYGYSLMATAQPAASQQPGVPILRSFE